MACISFFLLQGIIHFDSNVLGWKALANSWLNSRKCDEVDVSSALLTQHCMMLSLQCVKRLMDLVMNQVVDFVLNKSSVGDQQSEVSLTETCLSYLSSLIDVSNISPLGSLTCIVCILCSHCSVFGAINIH